MPEKSISAEIKNNPSAQVWVATDDQRILFYAASDPERGSELGRIVLPSEPTTLVYHCGQVSSFLDKERIFNANHATLTPIC